MSTSRRLVLLYYLLNISYFVRGLHQQLLTGPWTIRNLNNSINVSGSAPSGIYSDLMSAGILNDIYYRFNDIEYRWVANETWIYTHVFKADKKHFNKSHIELVFEGLDTISDIYLNNIHIGSTDNMFLKYRYNINQYIKNDENNLTIRFSSPIIEAQRLYEKQAQLYVVPPVCVPKEYHGECHVNHIRKMQASFSWDWGPAFPSVGIWKPVYLLSYNLASLSDVTVNISEKDDKWNVNLTIYLETYTVGTILSGQLISSLTTDIDEVKIFTEVYGKSNGMREYLQSISFFIPKGHVKLWWPNGYGTQSLYNLKIIFMPNNSGEKSVKKMKIGFRIVELIQNPIKNGLTFYFKVNHIKIFAKGSNWIPANILPEKGNNVKNIRYLLESAKEAHMNMLRVWGGGIYESDEFYNIADELGLLIWQDFMFACSMYPVNDAFIESVNMEIKQQVRRLQHHASIAVWAGNNENEAALQENWYGTYGNFSQYKKDYIKLYVKTIRTACLNNDQSRSFVVSSPSNGLESEEEGYIAKNPYDAHFGDVHYYNYILDGWDQNIYPKPRFASEYGFQSLPSIQTLRLSTNVTSDLVYGSEFLNSRQHHNLGYSEMKLLMIYHLKLPDDKKDSYLNTYIFFSQISQAMAIKTQTEHYRQWKSITDSSGNGLTMGALYWQLNDVWPAPSWSSIDFGRRWKMLHYYAKNFFAPVIVTANINSAGRELTLFIVSDLLTTIDKAQLIISVYKWNSFKPVSVEQKNVTIIPAYATIVDQFWLDKYLENKHCGYLSNAKYNCFIYFELYSSTGNKIAPDNFVLPAPLKTSSVLIKPNITVEIETEYDNSLKNTHFNLTVSTDAITPFVWLETIGYYGKFSDNGFLQVTKSKRLQFDSEIPMTQSQLQSSLTVTSMTNAEHL